VRKDNPKSLTTLASLNNPNVVVSFSANSEDYYNTKQFLPQAAERALTNATVADEIAEVESGHADADGLCSCLATALTTLFPWAAAVPTPPSSGLYGGVGSVGVSWGVRKGNPQLVAYLNTFISAEIANGTVRTLLETMQLPTA
jgi:ABC-type amino acid transport substrate-binding protein